MTSEKIAELRGIAKAATPVVAWYPHTKFETNPPTEATVRGPFHRWFHVRGGEGYSQHLGDLDDDARFAAAAMNNLAPLLDEVERLRAALKEVVACSDQHVIAASCQRPPGLIAREALAAAEARKDCAE